MSAKARQSTAFTEEQIASYIKLKAQDVQRWEMPPARVEFHMFYSA